VSDGKHLDSIDFTAQQIIYSIHSSPNVR